MIRPFNNPPFAPPKSYRCPNCNGRGRVRGSYTQPPQMCTECFDRKTVPISYWELKGKIPRIAYLAE